MHEVDPVGEIRKGPHGRVSTVTVSEIRERPVGWLGGDGRGQRRQQNLYI